MFGQHPTGNYQMLERAFTAKQQVIHDEVVALESAFFRGFKDFCNGKRQPHKLGKEYKRDLFKRSKAFARGDSKLINKINHRFISQGIYLIDTFKTGSLVPVETTAEVYGLANNPYRDGSLLAKEWERGFNDAYFRNQASNTT